MKYNCMVAIFRKWGIMKRIIGLIIFCLIVIGGLQVVEAYKDSQLTDSQRELKEYFEDEGHVISVLMPEYYYYGNGNYSDLESVMNIIMMKEFDYEDKVSTKIIKLDVETREDYLKEKNLLLSSKEGPTLIMIDLAVESLDDYVDNGVVDNVTKQLTNYNHIYDFLKHDYFIPLGMYSYGTLVDTDVITDMGENIPEASWTKEDYYELLEIWFEDHDVFVEFNEFDKIYNYYFADSKFMDMTGKVYMNTDENLDKVIALRDRFISNDYKIDPTKSMEEIKGLIDIQSREDWDAVREYFRQNKQDNFLIYENINALHPFSTYHPLLYRPVKLLPTVNKGDTNVSEVGFLVNTNGQNKEFGIELLNLIISDEYQFYIYEKKFFYSIAPSISTIEEQIKNKHPRQVGDVEKKVPQYAFDSRDQIIEDLSSGDIQTVRKSRAELILNRTFKSFVTEVAFNEEYFTRDQIEQKLKEFEREVYLQINE